MGGVKQNISDEERERRRQRMLDLRKRLAQVKEQSTEQIIKQKKDKLEKKEKKQKPKPEPIEEETEDDSVSESSSSDEEIIVRPKNKNAKPKAKPVMNVKHQQKKGMVRKVVKIKYYDDVNDEQIEADNRFLEGIHKVDAETSHKKKKSKQLKENDEPKQLKEEPTPAPEPIDPKQEKINRQMKELFG